MINWISTKDKMPELKPCPFCGRMVAVPVLEDVGNWVVMCGYQPCMASGPVRSTKSESINAWNMRFTRFDAKEPRWYR